MKWLVTALSVITVTIWATVLFFYLDFGQEPNIYAEQHTVMTDSRVYKNANFVFHSHESPSPIEVEVADNEVVPTDEEKITLNDISLDVSDDNKVSIDDILVALKIKF